MRHRLGYRKLNRESDARKALLRGLSTQLIVEGRVLTTLERAKELRGVVERMVTMARQDTVANRRAAAAWLYKKEAVARLFSVVSPANRSRPGGYTRILKLGYRPGDHARRVLIEFVETNLLKAEDAAAPVGANVAQEIG